MSETKLTESQKELLQRVHDMQYGMALAETKNIKEGADFEYGWFCAIETVTKWLQGIILDIHQLPTRKEITNMQKVMTDEYEKRNKIKWVKTGQKFAGTDMYRYEKEEA